MMFKGSDKYTWEDVNRIFDEIGARYNAFTQPGDDRVLRQRPAGVHRAGDRAPVAPAPPRHPHAGLRHREEGDPRRNRDVPRRPRPPPLREADGGALRQPPAVDEHPRLGRLDPEARARPDGATTSSSATGRATWSCRSTGRLDFDEIVRLAEKYMGDWPHVDAPREQPQPMYKPQRHRADRPQAQPPVHDGHDARPQRPGRPPLRRPRAGRRRSATPTARASTGPWSTTRSPRRPTSASTPTTRCGSLLHLPDHRPRRTEQALDIAMAELEKVKTDLNDDEVERAKNKIASSLVLQGEVPLGRMRSHRRAVDLQPGIPLARAGHGDPDGREPRRRSNSSWSDSRSTR